MSTHHPTFGSSSGGLGSVFKSLTKSLKPSSSKHVPVSINPIVVGGSEDLQLIVKQLQTTTSQIVKLEELEKLTDQVERYSISSIQEIWYIVRPYCKINQSHQIRIQGLKCCIACISKDDNSVGTKIRYFNDLLRFCQYQEKELDPDFDLILKALNLLTNQGRDIHDFLIYDEQKNLYGFIQKSLNIIMHQESKYIYEFDDSTLEKDSTYHNIIQFLVFVTNCLKFNYTVINEESVSSIIHKVTQFKSSNKRIIFGTLDILDSVSVFGHVPFDTIPKITWHISRIYGSSIDEDINLKIVQTIDNLFIDEASQSIISALCDIITKQDRFNDKEHVASCIGSMKLVHILIIKNAIEHKTKFDVEYFRIIQSLKFILSSKNPTMNSEYLNILDKFLAKDSYYDNYNLVLKDTMETVIPFQIWYSSSNSMYDVINLLEINTEQDLDKFQSICLSLQSLYENHELQTPKDRLIKLFSNYSQYLSNNTSLFVLQYYEEEKLCSMLNPFHKEISIKLLNQFYYNSKVDAIVKVKCLHTILEGHKVSQTIFKDVNCDLIIEILKKSIKETNDKVLVYLINIMFCEILQNCHTNVFQNLTLFLLPFFDEPKGDASMARSFVSSTASSKFSNKGYLVKVTKAICSTFIKSSAKRSFECFEFLINLANHTQSGDILLIICKCLIRIRTTDEAYIYVTQPSDMTGLASAFKRDDAIAAGQQWTYPELVDYLPEVNFNKPNKNLLLKISDDEMEFGKYYIDMKRWFSIVLSIMKNFMAWEVYSYVWAHFCAQLSNMKLFSHNDEEIISLKNIICDQLTLHLPSNLKLSDDLTKGDLQVAFVRTFSALIGYHDKFSKTDEDQIIDSLIFGLGSWEKTSIPCLNILTICCYEIPLSVKKYLSLILTKLQTKITSANASTHTLEFLMSLANLPTLTSNFTMDEFKRVFGIAFKYIQFSIDLENRLDVTNPNNSIQQHGVDATVEQTPSTQSSTITPILSQYISKLSYNVIANWFLKISMNDRKRISSFIIKNLINCNNEHELNDQTVGFLDFITRFTYSDLPLKIINSTLENTNPNTVINKWMIGESVVSIKSDIFTGDTDILIRKPTGVSKLMLQLDHQHQIDKQTIMINPNYFLLQLFNSKHKPIPIIEDPITTRALSVLDRIPSVEFHKIGIVYIGNNQSHENEVLQNKIGSSDYQLFLNKIGKLIKLKNNREIYLGGLDNENDTDGEYSRYWRGITTQVIFHITTMMNNPNSTSNFDDYDNQRLLDLKKRHIGNNYVNIFFDESGKQDFNFNLIKSQFNFLSVVIKPHTLTTELHSESELLDKKFFKVKTFRRSGVPAILATCHFKIVSQDELPKVVRNLAILASEFANVWHSNTLSGKFVSNWAQRVKQLKILKLKSMENYKNLQKEEQSTPSEKINGDLITQSLFDQLNENQNMENTKKLSTDHKYEFSNDIEEYEQNTKLLELYQSLEFNSYTS